MNYPILISDLVFSLFLIKRVSPNNTEKFLKDGGWVYLQVGLPLTKLFPK